MCYIEGRGNCRGLLSLKHCDRVHSIHLLPLCSKSFVPLPWALPPVGFVLSPYHCIGYHVAYMGLFISSLCWLGIVIFSLPKDIAVVSVPEYWWHRRRHGWGTGLLMEQHRLFCDFLTPILRRDVQFYMSF